MKFSISYYTLTKRKEQLPCINQKVLERTLNNLVFVIGVDPREITVTNENGTDVTKYFIQDKSRKEWE